VFYVVKRPFKKFKSETPPGEPEKYIDLGEMYLEGGEEIGAFPAKMNIKVAELHRYEDLGDLDPIVRLLFIGLCRHFKGVFAPLMKNSALLGNHRTA